MKTIQIINIVDKTPSKDWQVIGNWNKKMSTINMKQTIIVVILNVIEEIFINDIIYYYFKLYFIDYIPTL